MRTSLDLELDLQATRTWHSQLTQEISVLKELKEQLEQAKSHGEKELPQGLREDERFRLLLRMLEKRVSVVGNGRRPARSRQAPALTGSCRPEPHGECGSLGHQQQDPGVPLPSKLSTNSCPGPLAAFPRPVCKPLGFATHSSVQSITRGYLSCAGAHLNPTPGTLTCPLPVHAVPQSRRLPRAEEQTMY